MAGLTTDQRLEIIYKNLQDVMNKEIIEDVIKNQKRPLKIYWGTATTGRPHCGYFVPMIHIAQFLHAGCHVKILLADLHGFLDAQKSPEELLESRTAYYRFCVTELLKACNVDISRLEFVQGKDYQLSPGYIMDLFRLLSVTTEHDAKKSGAEVIKQLENPLMSGLVYPIMQALDEEYLDVDCQFGGMDQRKIFALANETLPRIGKKKRAHLMNHMVPGLGPPGQKMSASDASSKIDLLDSPDVIKSKIRKAVATPRIVEDNGVVAFVEFVLLPVSELHGGQQMFVVERRDAEPLIYTDIAKVKKDYQDEILTPQLLKAAVADALIKLLEPLRIAFQETKEWQEIEKKAYPPPPAEEKPAKKKKVKNLGTMFPGHKEKKPKQKQGQAPTNAQSGGSAKVTEGGAVTNVVSALEDTKLGDKEPAK